MSLHAKKAARFLKDELRVDWHDQTLWMIRQKRDRAAQTVPEWEMLREQASLIKAHVLSELDEYLMRFESEAEKNGAQVHWAKDADDFNKIILGLIRKYNAGNIVKSKSMLTEECGLNHFLEDNGIEVVDTDLGERIIQFRKEPPSHIVVPAIHLKKEEIGETFHEKIGTPEGLSDPYLLTQAAREHLRNKFRNADIGITGVNFAVADSGTVVVCTNEGNADMGVHTAPVQIHCMGIEKIVPSTEHLAVFTRMLARNATGQPITTYTSHYRKPKPGGAMHIVIVDNGRSAHLGSKDFRNALKCIRCGGCMNTCPVYRRSGGFSYSYVIPGPIGSILAPLHGMKKYNDLPFASSLCGSCSDVCPVKIDIHHQLYLWRQKMSQEKALPAMKTSVMKVAGEILASNASYNLMGKMARWGVKNMPRKLLYMPLNAWGKGRELPEAPKTSFKNWYKNNRKK